MVPKRNSATTTKTTTTAIITFMDIYLLNNYTIVVLRHAIISQAKYLGFVLDII